MWFLKRCEDGVHKYHPRYSKSAVKGPINIKGFGSAEDLTEPFRDVTYERDVCVRCGKTIEKNR
jgi:hypothetical protein